MVVLAEEPSLSPAPAAAVPLFRPPPPPVNEKDGDRDERGESGGQRCLLLLCASPPPPPSSTLLREAFGECGISLELAMRSWWLFRGLENIF